MQTDHSLIIHMQSLLCAFSSPSADIPAISLIRASASVVSFPALLASEACIYRWYPRLLPSGCYWDRRIPLGTRRDHESSQVREMTVRRSSDRDQSFLRSWRDWNHYILADAYCSPDSSYFHDSVPIA